ncbi:putative dual-specificity RNA methyltransferase RlmN [Dyadobacter sp. CECT 9623]|jgi:23S rRNA (adenine2503-C2)-methyltransferase|uniref:Probable dual-specificity RNA methyltransferase RlmN n=1 Tax=Dyadobacter linearis TaxID=2823330 RepID=A0ABN7R8D2_9BACT|nr:MULTISPECIES: 23S rRNA (adenine(2503)-C(2))-methyltransferase RlmN [unclassified Dyadobacter]MCE7058749.1 23S rRNA (adenine(2503)-C(2))-methyltransferase RlmN [Dyadobacter sp. CY343]CAG5069772.1 putative dual-specificity RNA methyltransferase RlmN [Dyadobacter sp. CECT 9623]
MTGIQDKQDIRKLTVDQLKGWMAEHGEKAFRAKQIYEWIWKKSSHSFAEMTNLSLPTRQLMDEHFVIHNMEVAKQQQSNDGTIKSAFRLFDGNLVEGVLIPATDRMTACVSSQVGCSLTCKFCATGYMDRKRNLEAGEIYDQVVAIARQAEGSFNAPLTNIVYMGMGEPLLNYTNVLKSIEHITSPEGLNMSPKRITVSTAGIAKMIKKLGDDEVRFRLALSLHAANDAKRNQIMPINESNSLDNLAEALNHFYRKTGNRITFEYIVFNNFNDTLQDAKELWEFTKRVPARVNIIEYNPIAEADFKNTEGDKLDKFAGFLDDRGVSVHVRRSRGKDIDAACGQLANKETA